MARARVRHPREPALMKMTARCPPRNLDQRRASADRSRSFMPFRLVWRRARPASESGGVASPRIDPAPRHRDPPFRLGVGRRRGRDLGGDVGIHAPGVTKSTLTNGEVAVRRGLARGSHGSHVSRPREAARAGAVCAPGTSTPPWGVGRHSAEAG
jgi:hypothetical protein